MPKVEKYAKKINGYLYVFVDGYIGHTKEAKVKAQKEAERLRKKGEHIRIIKTKWGYELYARTIKVRK